MAAQARLVSIVLPTHDGSRYIDEATAGWTVQTYQNWELIVVDDGSVDDTRERVAAWCERDGRVRLVSHGSNRGLPAALNTGFARARGDYLTWASDDNRSRPEALSEMAKFLDLHSEVDVVYTDYMLIDERGRALRRIEVAEARELARRNCIGPSFLYRRRVRDVVGGYAEDLALAEDYDFWLRASVNFTLKPLHLDLCWYRMHDRSLTAQHAARISAVADEVLGRNVQKLGWLDGAGKAECLVGLTVRSVQRGKLLAASKFLARALGERPGFTAGYLLRKTREKVWGGGERR